MLVRSRMTPDVLTVTPQTSLGEALRITREENIRHLPVVQDDRLLGVVTDRDLRLAAPPVWANSTDYDELRRTFEQKTVGEVMASHEIVATTEEMPIEEAARVMYQHKITCLPVMRAEKLVGILTDTDVMRSFVELFGMSETSRRIEVRMPNRPGELARVVRAIGVDLRVNITGMVVPPIAGSHDALAIIHAQTPNVEHVVETLRSLGYQVGSPSIELEPASAHVRDTANVRHWAADGY